MKSVATLQPVGLRISRVLQNNANQQCAGMKLPIAAAFRSRTTHTQRLDLQEKRPRHSASYCVRLIPVGVASSAQRGQSHEAKWHCRRAYNSVQRKHWPPAKKRTPIGDKNSATSLLTDKGRSWNTLRVRGPCCFLVGQDMGSFGPSKRCDCLRVHTQNEVGRTPWPGFGQILG